MINIYIYINIHSDTHTLWNIQPFKKTEILSFAMTQLELESITLSALSRSEIDKHRMISLM